MNRDIELLFLKAEKYIKSSDVLQKTGDLDSAVSRLYYSMFYSAEAILLSEGITFSSHRAVHSAFAQRFIMTGKLPEKMHRSLIRAFQKRQIGEYEAEPGFTAEEGCRVHPFRKAVPYSLNPRPRR